MLYNVLLLIVYIDSFDHYNWYIYACVWSHLKVKAVIMLEGKGCVITLEGTGGVYVCVIMFEGTSCVHVCVIMLNGTIHTIYNFQVDKLLNVWWKHSQIIFSHVQCPQATCSDSRF